VRLPRKKAQEARDIAGQTITENRSHPVRLLSQGQEALTDGYAVGGAPEAVPAGGRDVARKPWGQPEFLIQVSRFAAASSAASIHGFLQCHYSPGALKVAASRIILFFTHTVPRDWPTFKTLSIPRPRSLPDVLSIDEVRRLIDAVRTPHNKAFF